MKWFRAFFRRKTDINEESTIGPSAILDLVLDHCLGVLNHLFLYPKKYLAWQNFHYDDEIKIETEMATIRQQAVNFYDCEVQKVVPEISKCLDNDRNYVEK